MSTAGLAQVRPDGTCEPSILTAGSDLDQVARLLPADSECYTAADVISYVLNGKPASAVSEA
jgi:nitronate monooxygenase